MLFFSSIYNAFFPNVELRDLEQEARRAGLLAGQFEQQNRVILNQHRDKIGLTSVLRKANNKGLLTPANAQANFIGLSRHEHLDWVNQALDNLPILANTPDKLRVLRRHLNLADLLLNLSVAHDLGLLIQKVNFDAISAHADAKSLFFILSTVFRLNKLNPNSALLTPENRQNHFDDIVKIIGSHDVVMALRRIDTGALSEALILDILSLAARNKHDPSSACINIIRHLQGMHSFQFRAAQRVKPLEAAQPDEPNQPDAPDAPEDQEELILSGETYTSSVYDSASESAIKLKRNYGEKLNLNAKIAEMRAWLDTLKPTINRIPTPTNPTKIHSLNPAPSIKSINPSPSITEWQISTAKISFERLINDRDELSQFRDTVSGVKIKTLLALIWTAFNTPDRRLKCALDDAKNRLFEGLFEIQTGLDGMPLCNNGSFNKLIEIGWGIHPDMNIIFVDKTLALMKFPIIVRDIAINYLSTDPERSKHLRAIRAPDNYFSVEPIWGLIKADVSKVLSDEFPALFHPSTHAFFNSKLLTLDKFMASGKDVALSEAILAPIEKRRGANIHSLH